MTLVLAKMTGDELPLLHRGQAGVHSIVAVGTAFSMEKRRQDGGSLFGPKREGRAEETRVEQLRGGLSNYTATIPAGQVGVWAGSGTASVKIDDFVVRSLAARVDVDGRFVDDSGNVRVSAGRLEYHNSDGTARHTILRHVRMSKGIVQVDLNRDSNIACGLMLRYQDPENFGYVELGGGGLASLRYMEVVDGKKAVSRAFTSFAPGTGWITIKCVIDDFGGSQRLRIWVGGTLRLTTSDIDYTWDGGQVGPMRLTGSTTTTLQWDDFICGYDADGDDTIGTVASPDPGDYIYAAYDFNDPGGNTWQDIALSHDDNGNLTGDGLFQYTYDAWNRLAGVWYAAGDAALSMNSMVDTATISL